MKILTYMGDSGAERKTTVSAPASTQKPGSATVGGNEWAENDLGILQSILHLH